MRLYTKMPKSLAPFYEKELAEAKAAIDNLNLSAGWRHYERRISLGRNTPLSTAIYIGKCCASDFV